MLPQINISYRISMLEGEVKLRLGHFLVYGSREKCVQYCCWWRIIIRNYLRPVHASSETTYEARVLYVEGVCVCVCLNSNVYRSFIKADRRRKQSLNTAIWPALAKLVAFKPSPYEGLQKLRPTAGSGSQPSDWRPGLGSDDFEDILKFCKHWPWSLSHQSNHRYE